MPERPDRAYAGWIDGVALVLAGRAVIFVDGPYNTMPIAVVLCAYTVAERHGRRAAVVTLVLSLPLVLAILLPGVRWMLRIVNILQPQGADRRHILEQDFDRAL